MIISNAVNVHQLTWLHFFFLVTIRLFSVGHSSQFAKVCLAEHLFVEYLALPFAFKIW